MNYAILCNPGHNRVYFEASIALSISEFAIAAQKLSVKYENAESQNIFGLDYLTFQTSDELCESDIALVSDLSFFYALFKMETIGGELYFKPIAKIKDDFVDESMGTILKYTGKTNEIFTKMMINLAFHSQNNSREIKLLDPVAGKGTTLYEALIKGFDAYGIEIGEKIVTESSHFVKKFLETARYKFEYGENRFSGPNKSFTAFRHSFAAAKTKEGFKEKNTKTIELIAGNSMYADKYYKKNFFDIIVGDLPYGIQHGSVTNEKQSSLTRNPAELLNACLPPWSEVLKVGGAIALAWNCNVLVRKDMENIFAANNLTVKNDAIYLGFEHRVDQSIQRDIIVAVKK
ncbi:MAG: DNA methylase [Oscillospiraceae bacterium]|nr:DNA methylase [Oscillospiraceae bacterium]